MARAQNRGAQIDQLRAEIEMVLKHCQDEADRRVKAGVQWGHIHFKTDRPNTLFVLEPAVDGRRKYLHVGTDPQRQAQMRAAVDRGVRFARLREAIQRLKDDLREQDWEIDGVLAHTVYLHERAQEVVNQMVEVEAR